MFKRIAPFALFATALLPSASAGQQQAASINDRMTGDLFPVHDPAIILQKDWFYVFSTSQNGEAPGLIHIRRSKDLVTWERAGAVFQAIPEWAKEQVPGTGGIWAPDIVRHGDEYRVYYSISTFGKNRSAIGMASSPTLDPADPAYKWTDQGLVFGSTNADDFNAIDPNIFTDRDGRQWMSFGSFWTGIKMIELDPVTGKPKGSKPAVLSLARRATPGAVEAPFIVARGEYYYLFVSFDFCCRGKDSSYFTVVGRSKSVTGPYVDAKGRDMMDGRGEVVLHAKLDKSRRFVGPGHPAVLTQGDRAIIVYHAYDTKNGGRPTLRIQSMGWSEDGWPVAI